MKVNEMAMRTLLKKAKTLRARRKAYDKALKAERHDDVANIAEDVAKLENWFGANYPDMDIASDEALKDIVQQAETALKVLKPPAEKKKRRCKMISTEDMVTTTDKDETPTSKSRKRPEPVKRHPALQKRA